MRRTTLALTAILGCARIHADVAEPASQDEKRYLVVLDDRICANGVADYNGSADATHAMAEADAIMQIEEFIGRRLVKGDRINQTNYQHQGKTGSSYVCIALPEIGHLM